MIECRPMEDRHRGFSAVTAFWGPVTPQGVRLPRVIAKVG